jgi:hypothetical protein
MERATGSPDLLKTKSPNDLERLWAAAKSESAPTEEQD